jgi:hypothetical protein
MALEKVISGGQTGADAIALEIAHELGIPTGGTAPKGYRTEIGPNYYLRDVFNLKESTFEGYTDRTRQNILDADLTVVFGDIESPGSRLTINLCKQLQKPFLTNPTGAVLGGALAMHHVRILNVAGNRGSKFSEPRRVIMKQVLRQALGNR